jgi:PAS domain S-box-containing protein
MTPPPDRPPNSATAEPGQPFNINSSPFHDWLVKPISIVISISTLFILSIAIFWGYQQYKNSGAYMLAADKTNATMVASSIQRHNTTLLDILASYAQKPSFIDAAKKKNLIEARKLLSLLKNDSDLNLALITDKRGILWANYPSFPLGSSLSYRDWYKKVSANWKPHVSGVFQSTIGINSLVEAFSVPIFDDARNPIGILTIYKKPDLIAASAKAHSLDQITTLHVIDRTGNIIFDNKYEFQKKITSYPQFQLVKEALTENKKQIEIMNQESNQETIYLSIAEVESAGWLVIVERNFQGDLSPRQAQYPLDIIIIFALLFIMLSLSLIYFRKSIIFKNTTGQLKAEIKLLQAGEKERERQRNPQNQNNDKNIPSIVWDHDLIIVRFDHTFEEMTGWSKEEVLGKKIDVLFPENSKKDSLARISTIAKNETPEVLEVPILHSDGKTAMAQGHYITVRKQPLQENSILNGKLEKRVLERTANLESANRQLEAFSYSVSHALLTPLQNIEKSCDILKEKYQGQTDIEEINCLETMCRETKHMTQLIDDMQKLSRLNRTVINRQSVDASKMAREIMETCKQKYTARDVAVSIEKGIIIEGDEHLLKIVLENLIDNAWKFTASKERTVIKFGSTIKDGKKVLFIKDNGIGFDVAHLNKLFAPFQHNDPTTDTTGTGIGLATVQKIIYRHGGEIWADGKPGKGATFYFTLS